MKIENEVINLCHGKYKIKRKSDKIVKNHEKYPNTTQTLRDGSYVLDFNFSLIDTLYFKSFIESD